MPRPAMIETLQDGAERDPALLPDIDYDAEYHLLDLPSGAALREIRDRARLLYAAFDPDGLPESLQVPAAERAMRILLAADRLSQYWLSHGAAPPSSATLRPDAAPVVMRLVPREPEPQPHLAAQSTQPREASHGLQRSGSGRSAALRAALAARLAAPPPRRRFEEPQQRGPFAIAGAALVKLALAALVIAAVVRVQQYRADHPSLSPFADPNAVSPIGMPGEPPARWSGPPMPGRQVIGAAAPAIAGRQRPE